MISDLLDGYIVTVKMSAMMSIEFRFVETELLGLRKFLWILSFKTCLSKSWNFFAALS